MKATIDSWLLEIAKVLTATVWDSLSVVELLAIILCVVAIVAVLANGWDVYHERKRAIVTNGVKKILADGAWRRFFADLTKILAFLAIAVIASKAPPNHDESVKVRSAATTLLLLVILSSLVYNQINDYFTRRTAVLHLDLLYERVRNLSRAVQRKEQSE